MSDSEKPKTTWWKLIKNCYMYFDGKCKPIERCFEKCATLNILEHLGRPAAFLTIIAGMVFYMIGCPKRQMQAESQRRATHYQAWQIIKSGMGQRSSGGRVQALQDLNKDKVSLAGVDISKAYLLDLNLKNANLTEAILTDANLPGAILSNANLTKASLSWVGLVGVDLSNANLTKARLFGTDLTGANLTNTDFTKAVISGSNIRSADLTDANLTGEDLRHVNLSKAILRGTNLTGADLRGANLTDINGWKPIKSIKQANIYGVKNPPDGFVEWALEQGAVSIKDDKKWNKFLREKIQERTKEK